MHVEQDAVFLSGFPSPAEPWRESPLDMTDLLMPHPEATFFLRMQGPAMRDLGIREGDILVVDRALDPLSESIVAIVVHQKLLVRRISFLSDGIMLRSGHVRYPAFRVLPSMQYEIWGVVTCAIHSLYAPSSGGGDMCKFSLPCSHHEASACFKSPSKRSNIC